MSTKKSTSSRVTVVKNGIPYTASTAAKANALASKDSSSGGSSSSTPKTTSTPSSNSGGLSYDQALANLNAGGLKGADLAAAQASLKNAYGSAPRTLADPTTSTQPDQKQKPTLPTSTGDPTLDATLGALQQYLDELAKKGQVVNPNIQLDAATIAQFTKQAESEINPYYANQLKLARENLLTNAGYSRDEVLKNEQQLEKQYQTDFKNVGAAAADQGFALSGQRVQNEQKLATDTQNTIDTNRRTLDFNIGNTARAYAQKYGAPNAPQLDIGNAPTVTGGETGFGKPQGSRSLYTLDPNIYDGLTGSEQYQQSADVKNRASQLEQAFRSNQALDQQRTLIT